MKGNTGDFIQFLTEFTALLRAGLTVPDALMQCADRPSNKPLSKAIYLVLKDVMSGCSFSDALYKHQNVFDSFMVSAVITGESSGNLHEPLTKYRAYLERSESISKKVHQALVYPIFLLLAMAGILSLLFIFVMPRFTALYADFNTQLPYLTRVLMYITDNLKMIIPSIAVITIVLIVIYKILYSRENIRIKIDKLAVVLPYVKSVNAPLFVSRIAGTMHALLSGGMHISDALAVTEKSTDNFFYKSKIKAIAGRINSGLTFSSAAREEKIFPDTAVKLLEAGEASGELPKMMEEISLYYEKQAENRTGMLMALLEPVLIMVTGLVVGAVIIAMYLPVFKITEVIK